MLLKLLVVNFVFASELSCYDRINLQNGYSERICNSRRQEETRKSTRVLIVFPKSFADIAREETRSVFTKLPKALNQSISDNAKIIGDNEIEIFQIVRGHCVNSQGSLETKTAVEIIELIYEIRDIDIIFGVPCPGWMAVLSPFVKALHIPVLTIAPLSKDFEVFKGTNDEEIKNV